MSGATAYPAVTMVSRIRARMFESKTASWIPHAVIPSLRSFEAKLFHQCAPLLPLGGKVARDALDGGRIERNKPKIRHVLLHGRRRHDAPHFGVQLVDDIPRRRRRRKQYVPRDRFEIRCVGGLGKWRHVWEQRQTR